MVCDRIVDFRFFSVFELSQNMLVMHQQKLLIKQKTKSTWCVLLWKDYGWFVIEFSIFDLSSNFTGPDLQ